MSGTTGAVTVLEFNELSPTLMNRFIREGHLPGFAALRAQSSCYVTDAGERGANLEPWIQWVTIHTGLPFSQHKVFDLGDAHKLDAFRLWDLALEAGKRVWICGSMNASLRAKAAPGSAYFMPDPWSTAARPVPAGEFDTFYDLTSRYVKEHTRDQAPWSKKDYAAFAYYMIRRGLSLRTMWDTAAQLAREVKSKGYRWRRATLLDRLQWDLFRHIWKKQRPDFSTFFLNSTAHFQHYHWREFEPGVFSLPPSQDSAETEDAILVGYKSMDRIVQECLQMAPDATIVLMTALSQQPLLQYEGVGGKYIFKAHDHETLTQFAGVTSPYQYAPVMAEEFWLYFEDEAGAAQAAQALSGLSVDGKPVMRVRQNGREIFAGCNVFSQPASGALVSSRANNQSMLFNKLFYQIGGVKSGGHHQDGIFWIRSPGKSGVENSGKIPLVEAAQMLAGLVGVEFSHARDRSGNILDRAVA